MAQRSTRRDDGRLGAAPHRTLASFRWPCSSPSFPLPPSPPPLHSCSMVAARQAAACSVADELRPCHRSSDPASHSVGSCGWAMRGVSLRLAAHGTTVRGPARRAVVWRSGSRRGLPYWVGIPFYVHVVFFFIWHSFWLALWLCELTC
jgi:hypothetical protein